MIFSIDTYENSIKIDNGSEMINPIEIKLRTVCNGEYTEFIISVPKNSRITRGKKQLKITEEPYIIRVFEIK